MAVRSLFPSQPGGTAVGPSNALVTFKAGIMTDRPVPNSRKVRVTADKRKGEARLVKGTDGLVYFQWALRGAATPEKNLVLFPGDAKMSKIDTGRDGDRVYQLKFTHGDRRVYLWMQEPLESSDDANVKRLNDAIDNPDAAQAAAQAGAGTRTVSNEMLAQLLGAGAGGGGASNASAQRLLQAMVQNGASPSDVASLLGLGGGGGMNAGAPTAAGADGGASMMMDEDAALQAALAASLNDVNPPASTPAPAPAPAAEPSAEGESGTSATSAGDGSTPAATSGDDAEADESAAGEASAAPAADAPDSANAAPGVDAAGAGGAGAGGAVTMQALAAAMAAIASGEVGARPVPLRYIVDTSKVLPLLEDPEVQARLLPLLPESQRTPAALRETVQSPEFQSALASLTHAVQTNNVNTVFANFGLNPMDGAAEMARGDGVGAFLNALQARADRERGSDAEDEDTAGAEGGAGAGEGAGPDDA